MKKGEDGLGISFCPNDLKTKGTSYGFVLVMFNGQIINELETAATNREELLFYVMGGRDYAETANNS